MDEGGCSMFAEGIEDWVNAVALYHIKKSKAGFECYAEYKVYLN
jgi:hypothetical protein